jgi:hypothetical protein
VVHVLEVGPVGSGWFFTPCCRLVSTCEHVRNMCREAIDDMGGGNGRLLVWPSLGAGAAINWACAWEVEVVIHTEPHDGDSHIMHAEPGAVVRLPGPIDLAVLQLTRELVTQQSVVVGGASPHRPVCVPTTGTALSAAAAAVTTAGASAATSAPVASSAAIATPVAITHLRVDPSPTATLQPFQDLFCYGHPVDGGSTPTNTKGSFAGMSPDGKWVKFAGVVLEGHSGGPVVTASGMVVGWCVRAIGSDFGGIKQMMVVSAAQEVFGRALELL